MYCIQCGAKLSDTEKRCPLCDTPVYNPHIDITFAPSPYPPYKKPKEKLSRSGAIFILSMLFLIPIAVTMIIDFKITGKISWSGLVLGGVLTSYVICVLPLCFKHPNPVVFVPVDFAVVGMLLLYINLLFGGRWFLTLAFPICAIFGIIATAATALFKYLQSGRLYIWGGIWVSLGGAILLTEMFINITFSLRSFLLWSPYPAAVCGFISIILIVIAICKPMRESLEKKLFI